MEQALLSAFFSDDTPAYRFPAEPEPGDAVTIRLRTKKDGVSRATLMVGDTAAGGNAVGVLMRKIRSDAVFDEYEAELVCGAARLTYWFLADVPGGRVLYQKNGAAFFGVAEEPEVTLPFRVTPGFHVPAWAKGALQYQIFPDRFCNGNTQNDVTDNEYYYTVGHAKHVRDWDALPGDTDIRSFYGGDLQGILQKLDYLQSLGVEVLYLNPIFVSPSSHKYDVQDYDHIDPHLTVIVDDVEHAMQSWEKHNGFAPKYIRRVTSAKNLAASDAFFADFCREIHKRGMKIILDGVFNHCGSFHKWMDREGVYLGKEGFLKGAYRAPDSPYRDYFRFHEYGAAHNAEYEGWWGYTTLPKLNYEGSPALCEEILRIAEKWAKPPYSIDGWRLDVAADLGHSTEFNHKFWKTFRERVKAVNPDLLILAEHYGDPSDWLRGDEWDTVMNYDAFMEPVTYFLTGMEKHSDSVREDLYQNGDAFFDTMLRKMACFESPSLLAAMNQLSNHDHSRFLTRTNRTVGRINTTEENAASKGIRTGVFREAVTLQMTWPGAPTLYYADEAGQVGWTDPDSRRTYPWGHEDEGLIALHRSLAALRRELPYLRDGSLLPLASGHGYIVYARFSGEKCAVVALNNLDTVTAVPVTVRNAGACDGTVFTRCIRTDAEGFSDVRDERLTVRDGSLFLCLPPCSSTVLATV